MSIFGLVHVSLEASICWAYPLFSHSTKYALQWANLQYKDSTKNILILYADILQTLDWFFIGGYRFVSCGFPHSILNLHLCIDEIQSFGLIKDLKSFINNNMCLLQQRHMTELKGTLEVTKAKSVLAFPHLLLAFSPCPFLQEMPQNNLEGT